MPLSRQWLVLTQPRLSPVRLVRIEELDMEEFWVDRRLTNAEISSAISWVLGIDPHQITVFDVKEWSRQEIPRTPA
jgi:hypothetical protein